MKIFLLDDSPIVAKGIKVAMKPYHDIHVATTLKDAAFCLEIKPGVEAFDLLLFDASLPQEIVIGIKGEVLYNDVFGYNGLLFLLNNLDILSKHINHIAIITAFKNQIVTMENINVLGEHFRIRLQKSKSRNELEKIIVKTGSNELYIFTVLDKGRNAIVTDINQFIERTTIAKTEREI